MVADVVVVGAGPYGLSMAAHLAARGLRPLVFGRTMESWRCAAPLGMRLKSEGFASALSDPDGAFTLRAFCEARGLPYADVNYPTPVGDFIAYGDAFQRRFVPGLDNRLVANISRTARNFRVELEDGEVLFARSVVVATGLTSFARVPEPLRPLSPRRLAHTSELSDHSRYAGANVLVVGAGASATNAAAELLACGARVTLTCRAPELRFHPGGTPRRWFEALISPMTPVGPGWTKWMATRFPGLFRRLPEAVRVAIVDRTLGPAPAWFVRREIEGRIAVLSDSVILDSRETPGGVEVDLVQGGGTQKTLAFDHVVAGTGYRVDARRLTFLDPGLLDALALVGGAPKLSTRFESSVPGLYFVGVAAAYHFGPPQRFVCGAEFASRRVASALSGGARERTDRPAIIHPQADAAPVRSSRPTGFWRAPRHGPRRQASIGDQGLGR